MSRGRRGKSALSVSEVLGLLLLSGAAVVSQAHPPEGGGALDEDGCHDGAKTGDYHCHEGPLAGRAFSSRTEARLERRAKGPKADERPPRETLEERSAAPATPARRPGRRKSSPKGAPPRPEGERRAP